LPVELGAFLIRATFMAQIRRRACVISPSRRPILTEWVSLGRVTSATPRARTASSARPAVVVGRVVAALRFLGRRIVRADKCSHRVDVVPVPADGTKQHRVDRLDGSQT
jgi:hypothetical protein